MQFFYGWAVPVRVNSIPDRWRKQGLTVIAGESGSESVIGDTAARSILQLMALLRHYDGNQPRRYQCEVWEFQNPR
jgi:hypothetical protein